MHKKQFWFTPCVIGGLIIGTLVLIASITIYSVLVKTINYHQKESNWDTCDVAIANISNSVTVGGCVCNTYCFGIDTLEFDINKIPGECQNKCQYYRTVSLWSLISFFVIILGSIILASSCCVLVCNILNLNVCDDKYSLTESENILNLNARDDEYSLTQ